MTRQWTLAESRLIAERVMEWQVFEFRGRLVRVDAHHVTIHIITTIRVSGAFLGANCRDVWVRRRRGHSGSGSRGSCRHTCPHHLKVHSSLGGLELRGGSVVHTHVHSNVLGQ